MIQSDHINVLQSVGRLTKLRLLAQEQLVELLHTVPSTIWLVVDTSTSSLSVHPLVKSTVSPLKPPKTITNINILYTIINGSIKK